MADTLPPFLVSHEYAAQIAKAQTAAQAPKAGVKTTEFWLHIASLFVPVIMQVAGQSESVLMIAVAQAAASIYTLARTIVKARASKSVSEVAQATVAAP